MWRWLAVLMAACTSAPSAPVVHVVADPDPVVLDGARAWEAIGFEVSPEPSGFDACPPRWWTLGVTDCEITLEIVRFPMLVEKYGTAALTDWETGTVAIDTRLTGAELQQAAAHEAGHWLLKTKEHTQGGIMGGVSLTVQPVDRALACRSIGLGC